VVAIVRSAKYIATRAHPVLLTKLFGSRLLIMVRRAQAGELVEGQKRFHGETLFAAAFRDWDAMIDHLRRHDLPNLKTCFAKRVRLQFKTPQPFPTPRCVGPTGHLSH
jgi:hypothetical protein